MTTAIIGVGNIGSVLAQHLVGGGEPVVLAVWLDTTRHLVPEFAGLLDGKVVVDPSNPIDFDAGGRVRRSLPDGRSAASVVASMLPSGAHFAKAFGTPAADSLNGRLLELDEARPVVLATGVLT